MDPSVALTTPAPAAVAAVLAETLPRVARIAALVAAGVFLANVAVELGAVERVAGLSRYLTSPANLPDEVGAAVLTTAASTTAGYGMLAEFRDAGALDDRATLVAVTTNTFFGFVQHVFTFYLPVLVPILGLRVGLLYVGARAAVSLAITLTGVLAGALLLSAENVDPGTTLEAEADADGGDDLRAAAASAWARSWPTLRRVVPRLAVVYVAVAALLRFTDLTALTALADPLAGLVGLPGAAVPVVAVFALNTTAGATALAPLLGAPFSPEEAVATMLLGSIVSFAVSTFKRSIPFQYGVWGAEFGSKVVAVNTTLKVVFIGVALAALLA